MHTRNFLLIASLVVPLLAAPTPVPENVAIELRDASVVDKRESAVERGAFPNTALAPLIPDAAGAIKRLAAPVEIEESNIENIDDDVANVDGSDEDEDEDEEGEDENEADDALEISNEDEDEESQKRGLRGGGGKRGLRGGGGKRGLRGGGGKRGLRGGGGKRGLRGGGGKRGLRGGGGKRGLRGGGGKRGLRGGGGK